MNSIEGQQIIIKDNLGEQASFPSTNESAIEKLARLRDRRITMISRVPQGEDLFGTTAQTVAKLVVDCPKCEQQLGATRFALHYEKCLNKGSRARANVNAANVRAGAEGEEEWSTPCSSCRTIDTPEMMVLCDGCSRVYHMWCLVPRLSELPDGAWMCRKCMLRIVPPSSGEDPSLLLKKKRSARQSAKDKVKRGRIAVGVDLVDFYCDLCNTAIPSDQTRFRCLVCGEFDVCMKCKTKGGLGHRSSHPMIELKVA